MNEKKSGLRFLAASDYDDLEAEFSVPGEEFFVRREGGVWVVGQEGSARPPVPAAELIQAVELALDELDRRELPQEPDRT